MEKYKRPLSGALARKAIRDGIMLAAEFIAPTLGVRGRKIVLDKEFGNMEIVDDGAMILSKLELEDTSLQIGVKLLREAANKTNDRVGDGTTTTSILASELVNRVIGEYNPLLIKEEAGNVLRVKRELNAGVEKIIQFIDKHKIDIDSKRVADIGTISSNRREIGVILSELFEKLGSDASIIVSDGQALSTTYEITEGMSINRGFVSGFMITNPEKGEAVIENANVLVADYKVQNPHDAQELLIFCRDNKVNDLVIIADDIAGVPLDFLVNNKVRGNIRTIAVRAPAIGDYKEILKDVAILTGAQIVSAELGQGLKELKPEMLGHAVRVVATQDETTIVGGGGDPQQIKDRIKALENQLANTVMEFDKERLKERISKLGSGIGYIKVGGATELEVEEQKMKIDDAVNAVRAALRDGGIPGGGIMLLRAAQILDDNIVGESMLKDAIQKPFERIIMNADYDVNEAKEKVLASENMNFGFNVETEQYEDLVESGVIDPSLVAKTALQNAVSIALLVLTVAGANVLIREPRKDNDDSK